MTNQHDMEGWYWTLWLAFAIEQDRWMAQMEAKYSPTLGLQLKLQRNVQLIHQLIDAMTPSGCYWGVWKGAECCLRCGRAKPADKGLQARSCRGSSPLLLPLQNSIDTTFK